MPAAELWLAEAREGEAGIGPATHNHYVNGLKAFGNWLVKTRKVRENPFRFLAKLNEDVDVRRERRSLGEDEFARLLHTARLGRPFRGLSGPDRGRLYLTAAYAHRAAGRANWRRFLTPSVLQPLTATPPTLTGCGRSFETPSRRHASPAQRASCRTRPLDRHPSRLSSALAREVGEGQCGMAAD